MTDNELVEKIIDGNFQYFQTLYERYSEKVFQTSIGVLHNQQDAEDIVQEVFVEVYNSLHRFRQDSKFSTWLYRIAINKSINHLKKNKKNRFLKSIDSFFSNKESEKENIEISDLNVFSGEDKMHHEEQSKQLHDAIDALPENQKKAFVLHKYDDFSYKEIAEIMNTSLSSVESLIFRANQNLRKKLINTYKESFGS